MLLTYYEELALRAHRFERLMAESTDTEERKDARKSFLAIMKSMYYVELTYAENETIVIDEVPFADVYDSCLDCAYFELKNHGVLETFNLLAYQTL